jgi:[ribosomal protein S5]-alanine N-acetyltransferase
VTKFTLTAKDLFWKESRAISFCGRIKSVHTTDVLNQILIAPGESAVVHGSQMISRHAKREASLTIDCMLLQETIRTERLILRPFALTDAPQVKALAGDERIYETTLCVPYPYEDGMAESWISTHQRCFYEGLGVVFAISLPNGLLIGAASLSRVGLFNRAELGYWIGVAYWNRGYCTEAAKAIVDYGFKILTYHKISARHFVGNHPSGRVLEKVGMTREGVLQDDVMKDGSYITVALYGIVNPGEEIR